jgi:flagellar hook-associated protein 3
MIMDRTIFTLSRNLERFSNVQLMLSTGRRINKPSDDPIGTQHDLGFRKRLNEIEQYKSNINQGLGLMSFYESGLGDLKNLYETAKEVAVMMANDTYDDVAREAAANEVESLFQQVLQIANNQNDGRYLYSGHKTRTKPLEASTNGVVYMGDLGLVDMELEVASRLTSNLIGENVFLNQLMIMGENSDLDLGIIGTTPLAELNMGAGVDLVPGTFEVYDNNKNITYTIDISASVTVGDAVNAINAQLGAGSNFSVKISDTGTGLEWVPTIGATNSITNDTPLANLNSGTGVNQVPGSFRIRNADSSISFEVDISSASNIGDVITAINNALTANGVAGITVGFNADGTGLAINDTNGPPLGLTIEDLTTTPSTAYDLGIAGNLTPNIEGRDLNPQPDFVVREIGVQTTGANLGLLGNIRYDTIGADLNPQLTINSTLPALHNNSGFNLGELKISQGSQSAIVDLSNPSILTIGDMLAAINGSGLELTASINSAGTGIQIVPTATDKSLIITNNDSSRTAQDLGIAGSPDMLGSMMLLIQALRNNDRETAEQLNGNMDLAIQDLLNNRATVGARMMRMDTTLHRLEANEVNITRLLSEVEDADIIKLVSDLAKEENLYQAAMLASSKVIQTSLLDFLR